MYRTVKHRVEEMGAKLKAQRIAIVFLSHYYEGKDSYLSSNLVSMPGDGDEITPDFLKISRRLQDLSYQLATFAPDDARQQAGDGGLLLYPPLYELCQEMLRSNWQFFVAVRPYDATEWEMAELWVKPEEGAGVTALHSLADFHRDLWDIWHEEAHPEKVTTVDDPLKTLDQVAAGLREQAAQPIE